MSAALKEIFFYIVNQEDSQFALKEFKDVLTEYVTGYQAIDSKLREKNRKNIIVTTKDVSFTIISFRGAQSKILSKA